MSTCCIWLTTFFLSKSPFSHITEYSSLQSTLVAQALETARTYLPVVSSVANLISELDVLLSFATAAALGTAFYFILSYFYLHLLVGSKCKDSFLIFTSLFVAPGVYVRPTVLKQGEGICDLKANKCFCFLCVVFSLAKPPWSQQHRSFIPISNVLWHFHALLLCP